MIAVTPPVLRSRACPADEDLRRQIAAVTSKLSRYRQARDRARLRRLRSSPHLARMIAELLSARA